MTDPLSLPFDAEAMAHELMAWIAFESPTYDAAAVARMVDLAAMTLAELDATIEILPGRGGYGPSLRARLAHRRRGVPGVLISGHLDTVHPVGALAANPVRIEDGRLWGPGGLDMKGGCLMAVEALRQLAAAGIETPLPITVLFTPDEEVGTPSTRALIEAEARRHAYVLVPEPAPPQGGVTTGRYAIARFRLTAEGAPAHAGVAPEDGLSAVREMARRILEIEARSGTDATFSVNDLRSGRWVNCVPHWCTAQVLTMAKTEADLDAASAWLMAQAGTRNAISFTVERDVVRPVWPDGQPATTALYARAADIAARMGVALPSGSMGGGSDANFTGALGVATLCSLGPEGAGYHTAEEYVEIESLASRGRLFTALLAELA
ncbi:MAG: M20/M25/M40 family metallo-hydrolase [Pseudomonadota bacterium]